MYRASRGSVGLVLGAGIAFGLLLGATASAQTTAPPVEPGDPKRTIPERIEPAPPAPGPGQSGAGGAGSGEPLSKQLERSEGVIRPPAGVDPEMRKAPPVAPDSMPVIPPSAVPKQQ